MTIEKKDRANEKRHKGNPAMDEFMGGMFGLWMEITDDFPGVSISNKSGQPSGPFLRFVEAVLDELRQTIPKDLYEVAPELKQKLNPSKHALRERFRKIGLSQLGTMV